MFTTLARRSWHGILSTPQRSLTTLLARVPSKSIFMRTHRSLIYNHKHVLLGRWLPLSTSCSHPFLSLQVTHGGCHHSRVWTECDLFVLQLALWGIILYMSVTKHTHPLLLCSTWEGTCSFHIILNVINIFFKQFIWTFRLYKSYFSYPCPSNTLLLF